MTETNPTDPLRDALMRMDDPASAFEALVRFLELSPVERERVLGEMRKAARVSLILEVKIGPAPDGWWQRNEDGSRTRPRELCFVKVAPGVDFDDPALREEVEKLRMSGRAISLWREY